MTKDLGFDARTNRLACVFGVSGVGKSELIRRFVTAHQEWKYLAASDLLVKSTALDRDSLRSESRHAILENQFRIAELISAIRLADSTSHYILDAHSLIDNDHELVAVPTRVISSLAPTDLVFVLDEPEQIHFRRATDTTRLRARRSVQEIAKEQEIALTVSQGYATELKLILRCVRSGALSNLESALNDQ